MRAGWGEYSELGDSVHTNQSVTFSLIFFAGLQREPNSCPSISVEHFEEPPYQGLPLEPESDRGPGAKSQNNLESDYLARGRPSSNSSFHSSEEEGTDLEGDMLDCSGSRPLLMDSEEEDESCKTPQAGLVEKVNITQPEVCKEETTLTHGGKENQFQGFAQLTEEASGEPDVFATAPFRSARPHYDSMDIFTKAPFVTKGHMAPQVPEDTDVFLRAPFTKKKSTEELMVAQGATMDLPTQSTLHSQMGDGTPVINPLLSHLDRGIHPAALSPLAQYPMVGFLHQPNLPPNSIQSAESLDNLTSKGTLDSGGHPIDRNKGHLSQKEAASSSGASKSFRPQSLSKYSRHYSPENEPTLEAQPIAAYKVVSQSNKQSISGSVSITSFSSRTTELPSVDPFALAPFPSKSSKQKP
ncbi:uncharacterized protein FLJ45252-like [Antechinus flavipes]|uniref:uncharacterized protein FLJ45252-like n=1 Tax=Antechinus flavipes TaxID=38775 RepID=UPI002235D1DA|nr:uncharacterized protein FLJ45252-like [Antechinus flavipes]